MDYRTGKVRWKHEIGHGSNYMNMLSTAGKLLFSGDNLEDALALDPADGKTLWRVNLGGIMNNAPIT